MKVNATALALFISMLVTLTQFQNCTKVAFSEVQKKATISENILNTENPVPAPGSESEIPEDSEFTPPTTGTPGLPQLTDINFPAYFVCSDTKVSEAGGSLAQATSLVLQIKRSPFDSRVICEERDTNSILENLRRRSANGSVSTPRVAIKNCNLVKDEEYYLLLYDQNGNIIGDRKFVHMPSGTRDAFPELDIILDSNPEDNPNGIPGMEFVGSEFSCQVQASPLYVDFRRDSSDRDLLSSPNEGVMFDILGSRGNPAYTKRQISWFERGKIALLALPDGKGEVRNIDQLFGDNTLNSDGTYSENGFLSLAKHDIDNDGYINSSDAVYTKLRLWFDKNRNGIAEKQELRSLKETGVISIDLKYDPDYYERDQYGNEIKYKSVVHFRNGDMKSIFDVWFTLR